jgi:hypothetical protein
MGESKQQNSKDIQGIADEKSFASPVYKIAGLVGGIALVINVWSQKTGLPIAERIGYCIAMYVAYLIVFYLIMKFLGYFMRKNFLRRPRAAFPEKR